MTSYSDLLRVIAKRLPLKALIKFAQVSYATNCAAREAWQTWQQGCHDAGSCRMFSDKCWMDAYTRNLRQHAFRFVDATIVWMKITEPPEWLNDAMRGICSAELKKATFQFCVRRDYEVVNMVCMRGKDVWATISSTGEVWTFTDAFPYLDVLEYRVVSSFLNQIREFLRQKNVSDAPPPTKQKVLLHTTTKIRNDTKPKPCKRVSAPPNVKLKPMLTLFKGTKLTPDTCKKIKRSLPARLKS